MDSFEKYTVACIITAALSLVFIVCFDIYHDGETERTAIKQGLVQEVDQSKTIWVKP